MKLVVLGTAGYHPNERRQTTCLMIPQAGVILDAGTSFFRVPRYLQTDSIDIFLSHAHIDHTVGLTYLLDVLHEYPLDEVRVHAEAGKLAAVRRHLFSPELFPVEPPYIEKPLVDKVERDDLAVSFQSLPHPGGSVGYRLDWPGKSVAFITDTTACPDAPYLDFVRGVDLLVHECNFADGEEELAIKTGHSCLGAVSRLAQEAQVGGLVLLHFNPLEPGISTAQLSQAERTFSPIVLAEDGLEVDF